MGELGRIWKMSWPISRYKTQHQIGGSDENHEILVIRYIHTLDTCKMVGNSVTPPCKLCTTYIFY
jgi:hypothetical protein